jgi:single-strand DNA-binding protein
MKTICNSVRLIGNLGRDPEIKNFEDGKKLAKVSLATSDRFKNTKGEWVTETQWHNLVAWGKQAEIMERLLKKGAEVTVNGRIVSRNYEDKEGNKKYMTEIVVTELYLPGKKKEA